MNKKGMPGIKLIIGFVMLALILLIAWSVYKKGHDGFTDAANSCESTAIGKCVPRNGGCNDGVIITKESCGDEQVCCVTSSSGDGEGDTMTGMDTASYPAGTRQTINVPVASDAVRCIWYLRYVDGNFLVRQTTYNCGSPITFRIPSSVPEGSVLDLDTIHYKENNVDWASSSKLRITVS